MTVADKRASQFIVSVCSMILAGAATGGSIVYEPFDYDSTGAADGDGAYLGDGNQGGGIGLDGAWTQLINNVEMEVGFPGMTFTDSEGNELSVAGNRAYRTARDGFIAAWRPVKAEAIDALSADNSTLWMSFLYVDTGFSGPDSSVVLASAPPALANNHILNTAGYGIGIIIGENTATMETSAVETGYYLNSTIATRSTSTLYPHGPGGSTEGHVFLLAAKVNWNPDGTPDEIFLFNITDLTSEPQEADAIASDTFDMPLAGQQSLQYLNIVETQVDDFDEIRFGHTFEDVGGMPSPPPGTILVVR